MIKKYQLKNGMTVILIESHKAPVVSIQMWVRTGSADEPKGLEGISHFIEHLVFKGTDQFGVGEIAQEIESSGGILNAYTSFDQTVFYVTLSKAFTESGLNVISQMMGHPKFDPSEIDNEREVVIEEIKRSIDNPYQRASKLLFANSYRRHPYGIPVIGYAENIKTVTPKKIVKYYQSRYVPQNMTLLIVGNFQSKEMQLQVGKYFNDFKKTKLIKVKRKQEPPQKKPRWKIESAPFMESVLYLSWPVVGAKHKDHLKLSILSMILGAGDSSRLNSEVRNARQLVNFIGASSFMPEDKGIFAISAGLNNDRLSETLNTTIEVISKLIKEGIPSEELSKIKQQIESDKLYSLETVDGQAGLFGHFEFIYRDPKYFDRILKDLKSITTEDILKVAKKYLSPETVSVSYLTNGDVIKVEEQLENWLSKFRSNWKKVLVPKSKNKNVKQSKNKLLDWKLKSSEKIFPPNLVKLDNGIRVISRTIKGSPIISVRVGFLAGTRAEKNETRAANELLSRVWAAGTKGMSELEFNSRVESLASSIGGFGGRNTVGVNMTTLVPLFKEVMPLFTSVLVEPAMAEDIIEREKQMMNETLRSRADKPAQICMLNLTKEIFKGHPYSFDPMGTSDQINSLNYDRLIQHMATVVSSENMVISAVGDFDHEYLMGEISKMSTSMQKRNEFNNRFHLGPLNENVVEFVKQEKEQSHLAKAFRGLSFTDSDRYALDILQSILSGQGGRLFTELRDKASLAYTVSPIRMDGIDCGYFGAYIGCAPEKAKTALKMMDIEFDKLVHEPVGLDELERAKRYVLGRHDISLQKTSSYADQYFFDTIYNIGLEEAENYSDRIREVNSVDIQRVARKLFSQKSVISIVGKNNVSE